MENWKKCLNVVQKAKKVKKTLKSAGNVKWCSKFEKSRKSAQRSRKKGFFLLTGSRHGSLQDIVVNLKIFLLEITDDIKKGLFLQCHYTNPVQLPFPYIFGLRREWKLGT